jgi:predicted RNA-binding protein YlxR (DUF448 family)
MAKVRRVPQRQCVACRQMRPKRELVRVVRTPAGEVRVDPTGKVAGRGAYVCPAADCADVALRAGRLEHALETPIPDQAALALRELAARGAAARAAQTHDPRRPRHAGV